MAYTEQYVDDFGANDFFASDAALEQRMAFIRRTYLHLFGAILAFMGLEAFFFMNGTVRDGILNIVTLNWWAVIIAYMVVSMVASRWASSGASEGIQYLGLALYVVVEAVIFVPLLYYVQLIGAPDAIPTAALITLSIFGGLTAFVFMTKQDFSFLGGFLWLCGFAAIGLALASAFIGFSLGSGFAIAMVALMSGYILYDTSNVLHHYRTDQHVAASLALFASVSTLFWYVLRLVAIFGDD
ncbi:MAG: Bax inhibitor-1 family protein [Planctomycetota bacterium]|nr:Bax inhibitor-1 family protein [Planctomycetota bacterium]MDA1212565.1 Bax inhibitor-1 family protein [Planctomycetota bacterium]